jgi:hypothetical protein
MKSGGFDVVVGNPPYLDLKDMTEYEVKGYSTIVTRNLYPLILERCLSLVATNGRQGFIVPVSSVATEGYHELQAMLHKRGLLFSSYDDRPAHLFNGLDKNTLSILLVNPVAGVHNTFSTRLARWNADERGTLFALLQYRKTPGTRLSGCLPKVGSATDSSIWEKLFRRDKALTASYAGKSRFVTYYSRKVNAFLQVLDFVPDVRDGRGRKRPPSEFKELHLQSAGAAQAVFCCYNSTLFRWFIDVVTDGSHVNRREVDNFPFDPAAACKSHPELAKAAARLSSDLRQHAEKRVMRYAHDTLTVECIVPKFSKAVIDEIDQVLAKHYGFTDEELDFIINYDIKYRMGREGLKDER